MYGLSQTVSLRRSLFAVSLGRSLPAVSHGRSLFYGLSQTGSFFPGRWVGRWAGGKAGRRGRRGDLPAGTGHLIRERPVRLSPPWDPFCPSFPSPPVNTTAPARQQPRRYTGGEAGGREGLKRAGEVRKPEGKDSGTEAELRFVSRDEGREPDWSDWKRKGRGFSRRGSSRANGNRGGGVRKGRGEEEEEEEQEEQEEGGRDTQVAGKASPHTHTHTHTNETQTPV